MSLFTAGSGRMCVLWTFSSIFLNNLFIRLQVTIPMGVYTVLTGSVPIRRRYWITPNLQLLGYLMIP